MEFDPYSDDFFSGPWDTYRWMRDEQPVYRNEKHDFWALTRYEDVARGYKDWETYCSGQGIMLDQLNTPGFTGPGMMPGYAGVYDPPEYYRLRQLGSQGFTPRAVGAMEEAAQAAVLKYLGPIEKADRFDFVEDFAKQFPAEVLYDLMGIPEEDRQYTFDLFDKYMSAGDEDEAADGDQGVGAFNAVRMDAITKLMEYMGGLIQRKRGDLSDDIVSRILTTSYVDDAGNEQRLNDAEISAYLLQLTSAGIETTTKLMAGCLVALLRNPDEWRKVVANPDLIPKALEEAGRYEAPVQFLGRKSTKDVTLHGVTIPSGSNVLMMIGAANRDDRVYQDADNFLADRAMAKPPITFGFGPHTCLGVHLARLEAKTALTEVIKRWPDLQLDEDNLVRVRGFHVFGWQNVPVLAHASARAAM